MQSESLPLSLDEARGKTSRVALGSQAILMRGLARERASIASGPQRTRLRLADRVGFDGLPAIFLWSSKTRTDRVRRVPLIHGDVMILSGLLEEVRRDAGHISSIGRLGLNCSRCYFPLSFSIRSTLACRTISIKVHTNGEVSPRRRSRFEYAWVHIQSLDNSAHRMQCLLGVGACRGAQGRPWQADLLDPSAAEKNPPL